MMTRSIKNLIAAVLISVSAYLGWTDILPQYERTGQLKVIIAKNSEILSSKMSIVEKIKGINNQYQEKYTELQRLMLVVPAKESIPEIITTFESIFSETGNILTDLNIGAPENQPDFLNRVSFSVDIEGSYLNLLNMLDYLEKNIRLVDINKLSGAKTRAGETDSLSFTLEGNMYFVNPSVKLKDVEPAPSPAE